MYRNETLAYMQENYSGYIPEGADNPESLILVIELSPSIGSAQVQDCIFTLGEVEPISLPFTYVNEGDKTLVFTVLFAPYVFGDINVIICDTSILLSCVNCNIPVPIEGPSSAIQVITPEQYNTYTSGELVLTYPNLIFSIYSICGTFNGVTILTNGDTIDVNVTGAENLYNINPNPGFPISVNTIKTNIPIPGLPMDPPPTDQEIIDAINALNNPETPILASGTMVNSCREQQPIVMYESFFGRSMRHQMNGTRSSFFNVLKGKLSDKSVLPWFKKT